MDRAHNSSAHQPIKGVQDRSLTVYLRAYESVADAKSGIGKYFLFYNSRRPHTALDGATPDTVYFESQPLAAAA
jgi:transposase InsO family protein